jgi:DNA helicase-2/ATP-dependent DNA helicase PcrA
LLKLSKQQKDQVVQLCRSEGISVLDAIMRQEDDRKPSQKNKNQRFCDGIKRAATATPAQAISLMMDEEYEMHLMENPSALGKIELLRMLAERESDIKGFLVRLKELEQHMLSGSSPKEYKVVLSTIHSSKGLEYDSVYMVDVYDGRFPSSRVNIFSRSKDNADGEMEERRLFYVGITRARSFLQLFDIRNRQSAFVYELFPEETAHRREEEAQRLRPNRVVPPVSPRSVQETAVRAYRTREGYPEATVGMKLRHCVYGEMTVVGVEDRPGKTIIKVKDSDDKVSQKTWEVLLDNKMITILKN